MFMMLAALLAFVLMAVACLFFLVILIVQIRDDLGLPGRGFR